MKRMRIRIYCTIIVLLIATQAGAYPSASHDFSSAGAAVYFGGQSQRPSLYSTRTTISQSLSDISAANFAVLNGEGGACYHPTMANNPARRGISRPGDDDEDDLAIGEIIERSPIGDIPWLLMLAMIMGYAGLRMLKRKMSRHA